MKPMLLLLCALMIDASGAGTLDSRSQTIANQVLCPSCQGQSISESASPVAIKMRSQVNDLLKQGKTDDQIYAFLQSNYGQDVLLKPLLAGHTFVIWAAPFVLLGLIGLAIVRKTRFV